MAGARGVATASMFKVRPKDNVVFESCLGCFQIPIREIRRNRPFKPFLPHPPHTPSCPSHEVPLNALKGHSGALVFGGGEPLGRRQPAPQLVPLTPPHIPLYRVCGGGGGWLSNQRPDARTWARQGSRRQDGGSPYGGHPRSTTTFLRAFQKNKFSYFCALHVKGDSGKLRSKAFQVVRL